MKWSPDGETTKRHIDHYNKILIYSIIIIIVIVIVIIIIIVMDIFVLVVAVIINVDYMQLIRLCRIILIGGIGIYLLFAS